MKKAGLFDFDGVISNSFPMQYRFMKYIYNKFLAANNGGRPFPYENIDQLRRDWREPVYPDMYERIGFDCDKYKDVIWAEYKDVMEWGQPAFSGIREMISELSKKGIALGIASFNTRSGVRKNLSDHKLLSYFPVIVTRDDFVGTEKSLPRTKTGCLLKVIESFSESFDSIDCVGDQPSDLSAAKELKERGLPVRVIAVSYGYATRERLEQQNPDEIADSVEELSRILLRQG